MTMLLDVLCNRGSNQSMSMYRSSSSCRYSQMGPPDSVWGWGYNNRMQATAVPVVAATPSVPAAGYVTYATQVSDVIVASPTTVIAQMASSTTTAQVQEAHSLRQLENFVQTTEPVDLSTKSPEATTTEDGSTTNHSLSSSQDGDAAMERDKRAIYRHPLFPLMALLFEKCEQASQTADCPSSDSFDVDIQAFVHHQEQDGKPFFSEDPELDSLSVLEWKLANEDPDTTAIVIEIEICCPISANRKMFQANMVKAIQVLRIHLLELEKVSELCKDFCNRYTSCLKGKLQSENLLRCDLSGDSDDLGPTSPTTPLSSPGVPSMNGSNMFQQQPQQQAPVQNNMALTGQGQIVSGGTVYQMVQTPQGLVAQPIQIQQQQNQPTATTTPVIHGSTPLSQIGVSSQSPQQNNNNNNTPSVISPSMMLDDDDDDPKRKAKRGVLPKQATQIMKSWLFQHIVHPYPTEDEKRQIASQTNLTLLQVNNWFINARRRILQPMLDASNPSEAKAKKNKPNSQQRPVQRFWPESIANLQPKSEEGSEDGMEKLNETADSQSDRQSESSTPGSTPAVDNPLQTSHPNFLLPAGATITSEGTIQLPDGTRVQATSPTGHIVQNGEKGVNPEEKTTSPSDALSATHGAVESSDSSSLVD